MRFPLLAGLALIAGAAWAYLLHAPIERMRPYMRYVPSPPR